MRMKMRRMLKMKGRSIISFQRGRLSMKKRKMKMKVLNNGINKT